MALEGLPVGITEAPDVPALGGGERCHGIRGGDWPRGHPLVLVAVDSECDHFARTNHPRRWKALSRAHRPGGLAVATELAPPMVEEVSLGGRAQRLDGDVECIR